MIRALLGMEHVSVNMEGGMVSRHSRYNRCNQSEADGVSKLHNISASSAMGKSINSTPILHASWMNNNRASCTYDRYEIGSGTRGIGLKELISP